MAKLLLLLLLLVLGEIHVTVMILFLKASMEKSIFGIVDCYLFLMFSA